MPVDEVESQRLGELHPFALLLHQGPQECRSAVQTPWLLLDQRGCPHVLVHLLMRQGLSLSNLEVPLHELAGGDAVW